MALFRFRTRSSDRDRGTDLSRFAGIRQTIDATCTALEQERDGFRRRYDEVAMNAAFSLENMENEGETEKISSQIDDFSQALESFTQRIAFLEKQLAFLRGIDETVADFVDENGLVKGDTGADASV